jgi:5-methyltetrahydropteroyltriglutamate--homocysteine methyltransferase
VGCSFVGYCKNGGSAWTTWAFTPTRSSFFADTADIIKEEVRDLAAIGCGYIQIDAPELSVLVDPTAQAALYEKNGISSKRLLTEGVDLINSIAEAPGVTFGLHTCRGNNDGRWLAAGGYDAIVKEIVKRATRFEIFLLEYDNPRSGSSCLPPNAW